MQQLPSACLREGPVPGPAATPNSRGAAGPAPFWLHMGLQAYRQHQSSSSIILVAPSQHSQEFVRASSPPVVLVLPPSLMNEDDPILRTLNQPPACSRHYCKLGQVFKELLSW